jgi:hypothetical protein
MMLILKRRKGKVLLETAAMFFYISERQTYLGSLMLFGNVIAR